MKTSMFGTRALLIAMTVVALSSCTTDSVADGGTGGGKATGGGMGSGGGMGGGGGTMGLDASTPVDDAGTPVDAGTTVVDAGSSEDAGEPIDAGQSFDAGTPFDAGAGTPIDAGISATAITVASGTGTSISVNGGTIQLTATVVPAGANNPGITWSSSAPSVASVDATGLVTGLSNGAATITATLADGSGVTGQLAVTVSIPFVYFVSQTNGTASASLDGGTFSVAAAYSSSGNGFKYVAPNYYGTMSNGFLALPTLMTGDFQIDAEVTIVTQNKANNACGIGLGMTTGFAGTDSYAYILMRNSSNVVNALYVNSATSVSAGSPSVPFTNGTPIALTFNRTGTNLTYGAGPVGTAPTLNTAATSYFTNGTTVYGDGPVYPAISFNNVIATVTKLVIKNGSGAVVFDSATGILSTYIPASLTLGSSSARVEVAKTISLSANAVASGGGVSAVTASSADPTVATVSVANIATGSTLTVTGVKSGSTTITVTNTGDANAATNTKTIALNVFAFPTSDAYGSLATVTYPASGSTTAYTDGQLSLTFDGPPTLTAGGTIRIYKLADGSLVDTIGFTNETLTYGSTTLNVGSQLVSVSGNTVSFTPHLGTLAYGTGYYVAIPTNAISGTLNSMAFTGLSNAQSVASWQFTTRAAPTLVASNITVDGAHSGTANFRTVQGALDAIATSLPGATDVKINVAAGTYNELLRYSGSGPTSTVTISGPTGNTKGDSCVIQYTNGNTLNGSTQTRALSYFTGTNLVLQNLTLKNTGVRSAVTQAEALYFASGAGFTLAAYNSSFFSNQDTIQTSGQAWFYSSYIEGNVDFIWGTADAALFENCSLRFVNDLGAAASYSLFVARTGLTGSATVGKGFVLLNSTVSVDANVTATFGRDAGTGTFYDQVALINVTFTGAGAIGAGLWNVATAPLSLGDASYVGWKSTGISGLNFATLTTAPSTSATIANQSTEYDTRDHILNRVVTVTSGVPSGFQAAANVWNVSSLASAWGAP